MNKVRYNFYADTGGTFTDCIAIDNSGKFHRKKVLSSGAIRGIIREWINGQTVRIDESWDISPEILVGYNFRFLKDHGISAIIRKYNKVKNELHLDKDIPEKKRGKNTGFELSSGDEAPVLGAKLITNTGINENPPIDIVKLGSTKGTNALLERKGSKVLFVVTRGFEDLLRIGYQQRPDIFSRNVIKREPLYYEVIGIDERTDSSGKILKEPDMKKLKNDLNSLKNCERIDSVAVALMHSYKNPSNEEETGKFLSESGYSYISLSSDLSKMIKYISRSETTVVNAYLDKIIDTYISGMVRDFSDASFFVMNSAGGLAKASEFKPKESLLSGPAGGVVGAVSIGIASGFEKLITFDMGGTSTDVSRYGNKYDYRFEHEVGGAKIVSPALSIETVAAGGGSICHYDGFKLCVGPESAGAFPGPACYGAGGPLTITDINLLSGRLDPEQFGIPVFPVDADKKLEELLREIEQRSGEQREKGSILDGFLRIANEIMAGAIKRVSVLKGYDPSDYAMVAFGGAGGMHAASIAELLNISTIIFPEDAGLLSAYGMSTAPVERIREMQLMIPLENSESELSGKLRKLSSEASNILEKDGIPVEEITIRSQMVFLRLTGQDSSIEVEYGEGFDLRKDFNKKYNRLYGYESERDDIEIESIRVIASSRSEKINSVHFETEKYRPPPERNGIKNIPGDFKDIPVYFREGLRPGAVISGFALVLDKFSSWVIEEGWELEIDHTGSAIMFFKGEKGKNKYTSDNYSEIELELFTNRFMSIADNMGSMLQRVAVSVNVKERNDFSCALLDQHGKLVANAPHIPVHLGSLGICVRKVAESIKMGPGDTIITNHPGFGGSHLPDITLITPVFTSKESLVGYVVNRAHHAEIGGKTPGSMPPDAKYLTDEGVIIPPVHLVKSGVPQWEKISEILTNAQFPTRSLKENLADLNGALAANKAGEQALLDLVAEHSENIVKKYMELLKIHAARKTGEALAGFPSGEYYSEEHLDDGAALKMKLLIDGEKCQIDFTGTSPVQSGNMNATNAIVNSVVIYVLRLLIDEDIPLNDGLLDPVTIILPECLLNPSFEGDPGSLPAIVGGNVEVSQRLTDTILKPFGIIACSQGTMNNVLFGTSDFSYYETICGGCGAGPDFHGASAVHHHMTNTKITDPEILEYKYPVRLKNFSIRRGSGGAGKFSGGDGVKRELLFLEPVTLSVLTQHRIELPYGIKEGESGKAGKQFIITSGGDCVELNSIDGYNAGKGDMLVILTPGGGGYGDKV